MVAPHLGLSVELSTHGVRLSGTGLTVGEAGSHAALEDVLDQRPSRVPEVSRRNIETLDEGVRIVKTYSADRILH